MPLILALPYVLMAEVNQKMSRQTFQAAKEEGDYKLRFWLSKVTQEPFWVT